MTTATRQRDVVPFGEGRAEDRSLLGGKGANLAEMTRIGLPVPPGFIVTTDACRRYLADGEVPAHLFDDIDEALLALEDQVGRRLGDPESPLLLSVRSGAAVSMPGMMDTVLNLGATDETVPGLAAFGGERFAWDNTRRFLEMFGRVVLGVPEEEFEANLQTAIEEAAVTDERGLDADHLAGVAAAHRDTIEAAGQEFPEDPQAQLRLAVEAVFRSWNGDRARAYRRMEGIADDLGTAVTIQAMVFGNRDERSATGVAFTRDPATGEPTPYGDYLSGAQGEDVVAGTRRVRSLADMRSDFPEQHAELLDHLATLEAHYRDLCDVEFTIEDGTLWMLQTRVGKRSAAAALRIAVDLVDEEVIDPDEAVRRVQPHQLEQLLHPRFRDDAPAPLTTGLAASPGAAVGAICLDSDEARRGGMAGEQLILVRPETSPEDIEGMAAAVGLLTSRGGLVSHAAVLARGMGKPAVCGAHDLQIDAAAGTVTVGDTVLNVGDVISLDGTTGQVAVGEVELEVPGDDPQLERLLGWADERRTLRVLANADTADDAERALAAGAEGIGLCRTEHQFVGDRLPLIQRVILAAGPTGEPGEPGEGDGAEEERRALAELEQQQAADFEELFAVMDGRLVVIRLLDPPMHEFLPDVEELHIKAATEELTDREQALLRSAEQLAEHDPMLGVRGIRLGILRPEIYRAQIRAVLGAAAARRAAGGDPRPEIMLPLVSSAAELAWGIELIRVVAQELVAAGGEPVDYTVATMIETPRAALTAGELAPHVDAFSFGTNDLTQLTYGLSRDDVEATYMPRSLELELLEVDPFRTLDPEGVGRLIELAVTEGQAARPDLVTGICGEHGGDPDSIMLAHRYGLAHVSCSPARLKVARLAAAHAALEVTGPSTTA